MGFFPHFSSFHIYAHCLCAQSCLTLCDPWTVAYQAPLSMGFPRQEYWGEFPFPAPGGLPDHCFWGIELVSPALLVDSSLSHLGSPHICVNILHCFSLSGLLHSVGQRLLFKTAPTPPLPLCQHLLWCDWAVLPIRRGGLWAHPGLWAALWLALANSIFIMKTYANLAWKCMRYREKGQVCQMSWLRLQIHGRTWPRSIKSPGQPLAHNRCMKSFSLGL